VPRNIVGCYRCAVPQCVLVSVFKFFSGFGIRVALSEHDVDWWIDPGRRQIINGRAHSSQI
jgi:hypothetical protein